MKFKRYNKEIKFLIKMVKDSAKIIKKGKMEVNNKGEDDLVTNLDFAVEKYIIENIKKKYPNFDIVSEEFNSNKSLTDNCFTIDPIDGTINFANNIPQWAIQVACRVNGETVVGVIYSPSTNDLYYAVKGEGAYKNGKRINVSSLPLKRVLFTAHGHGENTKYITKIYEMMDGVANNYRRIGATSLTLAYIANGSIGGTIILNPTPWDDTPGMLLCEEAGAIINIDKHGFIVIGNGESFINYANEILKKLFKD